MLSCHLTRQAGRLGPGLRLPTIARQFGQTPTRSLFTKPSTTSTIAQPRGSAPRRHSKALALGPFFTRQLSGAPLPQSRSNSLNFLYRSAAIFGTSIVVVSVGIVGFFL